MTLLAADIAVIGGGAHGLFAALHLARRGQQVILLERDWIGAHASGASAAGVRSLGRDPAEIALARESIALWPRMAEIVGDDCGFHAVGQLRLADTKGRNVLVARAAQTRALGWAHERILDESEIRRLVPGLAQQFVAGLHVDDEGSADPHRTLRAFRRAAEAAGVNIHERASVSAAEQQGDGWRLICDGLTVHAPQVVNAAGAWAGRVAAMFGETIELATKASMMLVTERVAAAGIPVIGVAGRSLSLKQTGQGTMLVGGGVQGSFDLDTRRAEVRMALAARGVRNAIEVLPGIGNVVITRAWAGIEAATRDLLPVIGPSTVAKGLVHVFGFSGHGFALLTSVGPIVADLVTQGVSKHDLSAFAASRLHPLAEG